MKRFVKKTKPRNIEVQAAYNGKQLSSCFETKDEQKLSINTILYISESYGRLYWGISKTCNKYSGHVIQME